MRLEVAVEAFVASIHHLPKHNRHDAVMLSV